MSTDRDRHGRGPRGPLAWPPVPSATSRRQDFEVAVLDIGERLEVPLGARGLRAEFAISDVPTPYAGQSDSIPLGHAVLGADRRTVRVVVYRRPIQMRASEPDELRTLIYHVVLDQLADVLGLSAEDLEG